MCSIIIMCLMMEHMTWDRQDDTLLLSKNCNEIPKTESVISKRVILSAAHRLFDPLGISCPVTLIPKWLIQRSWVQQKSWDEEVDDEVKQEFLRWQAELHHLGGLKIPRCLRGKMNQELCSIHCFCDASCQAYAAAVFLRSGTENNAVVQLIIAKTRVAPLKPTTIPRLELLGATIGVRLVQSVQESEEFKRMPVTYWTDSSTALSWIVRKDHWGPFVYNRVKEIRELSSTEDWKHVPGAVNPADLPSRGCMPQQLIQSRWWEGPSWLKKPKSEWPKQEFTCDEEEISKEKRKGISVTAMNVGREMEWSYAYFSNYNKMLRMVAWILRFVYNCRNSNKRKGILTVEEINTAEIKILQNVQKEEFNGIGDKRLATLCPFEAEDGLIRIQTKISDSNYEENFKHPIVLPAKHVVVTRLIHWIYVQNCHVGTQGLLAILRERFWILTGRKTVRAVVTKCTRCRRYDAKPIVTPPVPLPKDRVNDVAAFQVTGVDLAGPLILKNGKKCWICLFTCAVFRAVHMELLTSLSTERFLQGLRRFVARRGRPTIIWTDNATNFVGAANALAFLDWKDIEERSCVDRIEWRFTPPAAPWWGGWWERLIGLAKKLLRKVLARASLDSEELYTIICDCEAVMNQRPLTYLSEDPQEFQALTPAHFLRELGTDEVPDIDKVDIVNFGKRAKRLQSLRNTFRKRFRQEYLGQLILHSGRSRKGYKLKIGDVVLIGYDNWKRLDWPLGVVKEVILGRDGQSRLARVKTTSGVIMRPLERLYPLEVVDECFKNYIN